MLITQNRITRLQYIERGLTLYSRNTRRLEGLTTELHLKCLSLQILSSTRRYDYLEIISSRDVSICRTDPLNPLFDPYRAAVYHLRQQDFDESCWLIFLATHFGNHGTYGWKRLREVYSGLGSTRWTWKAVTTSPTSFFQWLQLNASRIGGGFGNHRKYETMNPASTNGTSAVIASYLEWVGPSNSHRDMLNRILQGTGNSPESAFNALYQEIKIKRFARLAKFDFLATLGHLDIIRVSAGSAYLKNATGPLKGARLLFANNREATIAPAQLEDWLRDLDIYLDVGMEVLEDAICNWQKSPSRFIHFKG